jgi:hypothetical protein
MPTAQILRSPEDLLAMMAADDLPQAPLRTEEAASAGEQDDGPLFTGGGLSLPPLPAGDSSEIFALDLAPALASPAVLSGQEPPLSPPAVGEDVFSSVRGALEPNMADLARFGYDSGNQDPTGVNLRATLRRLIRRL